MRILNEDFDTILVRIRKGFEPEKAENDEAYEKALIHFLNLRI